MAESSPRRYQIPTHLDTPDTIDLPLFGITVSLTMRQGVCFLLGGSLIYQIWLASFDLSGIVGLLAHWVLPVVLIVTTFVFAVHQHQGRYLEGWILVLMQYHSRPKVFVWRHVLSDERRASSPEEGSTEKKENEDEENAL